MGAELRRFFVQAFGRSTSFWASFTMSISDPPPCMFNVLTMSERSACGTDAWDARCHVSLL
jgi:hypothetical protein